MSTTPTPTHRAMRDDLGELLTALEGQYGRAVRLAIRREVFGLFDSLTAKPEAASDTNGSEPEQVEHALFREPAPDELRVMETLAGTVPNGIEVNQ